MKLYDFTLVVNEISEQNEEAVNLLFKNGCNDSFITYGKDGCYIEFTRKSSSALSAITSAIKNVNKAGFRVNRIEPGDYVTEPEIRRRLNMTREYIRLIINGKRGPGSFPSPISGVKNNLIYRWGEICEWAIASNMFKNKIHSESLEVSTAIGFLVSKAKKVVTLPRSKNLSSKKRSKKTRVKVSENPAFVRQ